MTTPSTRLPGASIPIGEVVVTAHRGAMSEAPENSLRAFRRAIELGADELEFDVRATADGELVILHDATLDRTTDGSGPLAERTLAELDGVRVGGTEPVPTLDEVLALPDIRLQIELKEPALVARVAERVHAAGAADRAILTSFHAEALEQDHGLPRGLIAGAKEGDKFALGHRLGVDRMLPHWNVLPALKPWYARRPRWQGAIGVWPCRDEASIRRALSGEFFGLTTDETALALDLRAELSGV